MSLSERSLSNPEQSLSNCLSYDEEPDLAPCNPVKVGYGALRWLQLIPAEQERQRAEEQKE